VGPKPTLKSVAAAAGVSTAQVSYAFNRPDRLSAQARARILTVARQQGYSGPDAAARSLRTGRAGAIGVLFTVGLSYAFSDPYLTALLGGLAEVTEQTQTGLVLIPFELSTSSLDDDAVRQSLGAVHRAVIDGAVVADALTDDHPAVQALRDRKIPLIRESMTQSDRYVAIDDRAAALEVGRHLAAFGHQDVAVLVSCPSPPGTRVHAADEGRLNLYSRLRLAGIRDGLGPDVRVRVVSGGRNAPESAGVAAALVLDQPDRPSAIAADSDIMAIGVLEVVRRRSLEPGSDISVTGFDDVPAAASGGLTTIRQPIRDKGRLMGRMLLDPTFTEERMVLPTYLVARSSTGPAPRQRSGPARTTAHRHQTSPEGTPTVTNELLTGSPNATGSRSEWHSDRLDLDAYLRRIGYTGPLRANGQTLAALHSAHVGAIAFENLDIILGRGIAVDLEHVQAKLVDRRRGGYCYEHGILFGAVAERLGFQVDRLLARTGDPAEHPRPRSHLVLRVATAREQWLADVGFGSGLLAPLPLAAAGPQQQGAWEYELLQGPGSVWRLRESDGQSWTTIISFTEEPQYFVDVEVANYNTSTNPNSPFVQRPIVVRKDATSVRRLLGREYSIERPGRPADQRRLTDGEFAKVLRSDFGLVLTEAEVSALAAARPVDTADDDPPVLGLSTASGEKHGDE
jgi:DNA-binding LacI/PurR family transcriptional regulator/arylamine N-acetyltransferase